MEDYDYDLVLTSALRNGMLGFFDGVNAARYEFSNLKTPDSIKERSTPTLKFERDDSIPVMELNIYSRSHVDTTVSLDR